MMNNRACLIMGLPAAGKTTYLAALAALLREPAVEKKLHWPNYVENAHHLMSLAETWWEGEEVVHTSKDIEMRELPLHLKDMEGGSYRVCVPDLSGESFQELFTGRVADAEMVESFRDCNGILLFIHPEEIHEPVLISRLPLRTSIQPGQSGDGFPEENPEALIPTAVYLTELMQFAVEIRESRPVTLGVVVSAWDIVSTLDESWCPEEFVHRRLPLLWQYLMSNPEIFHVRYYGVSAQGGSLRDGNADALLCRYEENPIERMWAVTSEGEHTHDLSLILWETLKE